MNSVNLRHVVAFAPYCVPVIHDIHDLTPGGPDGVIRRALWVERSQISSGATYVDIVTHAAVGSLRWDDQ